MYFPFHRFKSAPCAFHFVEKFYFVESSLKIDETWNHRIEKRLKYEKVHTEQTNTSSKTTMETLEQGGE